MKQIKTTLFSKNKNGSTQEWKVFVAYAEVIVEFGQVGGKKQLKKTTCEAKNIGRSNETTPIQQAELEAISKWENQVRLGYRDNIEDLQSDVQISPMLAKDATKVPHLIEYPCYVSAKLDGLRCLVTFDEKGEPVFNSRGNKTYPIKGEIVKQIKTLREESGFDMFDGEVYLHGLSLQKIVSLSKKWRTKDDTEAEINKEYLTEFKKWKKDPEKYIEPKLNIDKYGGFCSDDLEFHIFDIPSEKVWESNNGYSNLWDYNKYPCRYADLMNTDRQVSLLSLDKIEVVHGTFMEDEHQVKDCIGFYMQRGYEGVIIRNFKGIYEFNQRSSDLLKWKIFEETEAKVVDVELDKNGEGVLTCQDIDGIVVRMKIKGTHAERSYESQLKNIGKFINFTYQARTDDNNYSFPVGQYFRDVNPRTWEVEE